VEPEADPLEWFRRWWEEARATMGEDADAMALATTDAAGHPSVRMVILRGFDDRGFAFYTNLESPKARHLAEHRLAALLFYWAPLHRQVRVKGLAEQVPREEAERYWRGRPAGHRVAALASPQSRVLESPEDLPRLYEEARRRHGDDPPLPDFWGGFRVMPEVVEFWQGREHRLHDRIRYRRVEGGWDVERLAP
jgi:pyridoxamine 5'-phosphate oxidase